MTLETDTKEYLGDGLYVHFDGYHIVLTAENGMRVLERVCLEPAVLKVFDQYRKTLKAYLEIRERKGGS